MSERSRIAVCGCGAAGPTLAAYLISRGFQVNLYEHPEFVGRGLTPFQERGGIEAKGAVFNGFFRPNLMTADITEALDDVDIAMLAAPAFAHENFAKIIIPNLRPGQILLNWTSYWFSLRFWSIFKQKGPEDGILSEGRIYPFMTRRLGPSLVYVDAMKRELKVGAMPYENTGRVVDVLKKLFPESNIVPAANVLETALENGNVKTHTAMALLNVALWEKTHGDVAFYHDLISPGVGAVLDAQDREKLAIGKALGLNLQPGPDQNREEYGHLGVRGEGSFETLNTLESHKAWRPRFGLNDSTSIIAEDVPCGLVPMSSLAKLLGVPTPTIDSLIHIGSVVTGLDFPGTGLTIEKLGLAGMTAKQVVEYATTARKGD